MSTRPCREANNIVHIDGAASATCRPETSRDDENRSNRRGASWQVKPSGVGGRVVLPGRGRCWRARRAGWVPGRRGRCSAGRRKRGGRCGRSRREGAGRPRRGDLRRARRRRADRPRSGPPDRRRVLMPRGAGNWLYWCPYRFDADRDPAPARRPGPAAAALVSEARVACHGAFQRRLALGERAVQSGRVLAVGG